MYEFGRLLAIRIPVPILDGLQEFFAHCLQSDFLRHLAQGSLLRGFALLARALGQLPARAAARGNQGDLQRVARPAGAAIGHPTSGMIVPAAPPGAFDLLRNLDWHACAPCLYPPATAKKQQHGRSDEQEDAPNHQVPPTPVQFGHKIKVHAVDAGDKAERDKDG